MPDAARASEPETGVAPGLCLIGGRWVPPASGGTLPVEDPSTGEEFGRIARGGAEDVDAAVTAAGEALAGEWGAMPPAERGRLLSRLGRLVEDEVERLARLEARDVGKPLTQARADARALGRSMEFYGGAADKVHGATIPYLPGYTV
jgi:aldehyde dehydrogenase (NAD+)